MGGFLTVLIHVLQGLKTLGLAGHIGYVAGLSIWTFLCLPTTPIELASGFIFPSLWLSTLMSVAGKTIGSVIALVVGRRLLKPLIARVLSANNNLLQHLINELRERPIQTMSMLRAAPLPTPFKIYGLCLMPAELVPVSTYLVVALCINSVWSLVWTLTGSSASSLQDAVSGSGSSRGALVAKLLTIGCLMVAFASFTRFAKAQLLRPVSDAPAPLNERLTAQDGARASRSSTGMRLRCSPARRTLRSPVPSKRRASPSPPSSSRSATRPPQHQLVPREPR